MMDEAISKKHGELIPLVHTDGTMTLLADESSFSLSLKDVQSILHRLFDKMEFRVQPVGGEEVVYKIEPYSWEDNEGNPRVLGFVKTPEVHYSISLKRVEVKVNENHQG